VIFWVLRPRGIGDRYRRFGGTCCPRLHYYTAPATRKSLSKIYWCCFQTSEINVCNDDSIQALQIQEFSVQNETIVHVFWTWIRHPEVTQTMVSAYEGVSKSFRTGRLQRELQMVQLSATRCSYIAIFWVSLVSFAAITLCVASQRVCVVKAHIFVIGWVRKLLDIP
jgi:hypothetical protein